MRAFMTTKIKAKTKTVVEEKPAGKPAARMKQHSSDKIRVVNKISVPNNSSTGDARKTKGVRLPPQFAFMKAPGIAHDFQVGDTVEVYCDHEKNKERIRGWIRGIVVQVDNKMVAVQFRSNVFLTDGWMVPDRILWYPLNSEHIRATNKKASKRGEKALPDF